TDAALAARFRAEGLSPLSPEARAPFGHLHEEPQHEAQPPAPHPAGCAPANGGGGDAQLAEDVQTGGEAAAASLPDTPPAPWRRAYARIAPGSRPYTVAQRVLVGTYYDGFIHAGNLAYLSLIALFPFFITATALMGAFGQTQEGLHALEVVQAVMPPNVARTLDTPVREVLQARTGPLLWLGGAIGLWTVGSLIETIRDILRRAYGTPATRSFWHYRFYSILIIVAAVLVMLASFSLQVVTVGVEQVAARWLPPHMAEYVSIGLPRAVSMLGLFASFHFIFLSLTPESYRGRANPKWPGALVVTLWWVGVTLALPPLVAGLISYDLTYGSMAGVMVVLFFFYLIGLGVVIGAELNAALADRPAAQPNRIGQMDDRERRSKAHE
ncbi:MAG: YihY/virulence factor BrkB family protein, partial [Sphingopyxis sp.]